MKRATIRTRHERPELLARSLQPDNTTDMHTAVEGDVLETRIQRETIGGLRTTLDDYIVNLLVATRTSGGRRNETMTNDAATNSHQ